MNDAQSGDRGWEAKVRRQTTKLGYWTLAWLVTMAISNFGPKYLWASNEFMTMAAIGLNVLVGIGMIVANKDHLRNLDEMQQKIQLEAMGVTLGVALVVGLAYSNLEITKIISFDASIPVLVVLMSFTYLATLVFLNRKMR